ncbi:hypothetical protein KY310_01520 [Candidatus Woesearchaeota archaeon]|nr:hypothetical protein [Candidatus Woesearchaeota archaeon]
MAESLDAELCVHYRASRRELKETGKKDSKYELRGCYDCDGITKDCNNKTPLNELLFDLGEE